MAMFYSPLCSDVGRPVDSSLLEELQVSNKAELTKLEEAITDAQENLGDTELKDALMARAEYLCKIGDKVREEGRYSEVGRDGQNSAGHPFIG